MANACEKCGYFSIFRCKCENKQLQAELKRAKEALVEYGRHLDEYNKSALAILALVNNQAKDEGLWFIAKFATEAYFQQELRRLHVAIETNFQALKGEPR